MNGCLNKGSCIFDQEKEAFVCSCKQPWRGERCELGKRTRYAILLTARSLFVFHYHLEIYTAMAVFLYRSLSGQYMFNVKEIVHQMGTRKKNPSPRWDLNPRPSVI